MRFLSLNNNIGLHFDFSTKVIDVKISFNFRRLDCKSCLLGTVLRKETIATYSAFAVLNFAAGCHSMKANKKY